jgi:hypothetical protein
MPLLRRCITRLSLPFVWRLNPDRKAAALGEFATTEMDSAWQSIWALRHTADPKLRAQLFQHALEEIDHSGQFDRVFRAHSRTPSSSAPFERKVLFDAAKGERAAIEFFAYECIGETDIRDEFQTYAAAAPDADVKAVFLSVERDELGHAAYTNHVLTGLVADDPRRRRRALWRARGRRLYEGWLRFGRKLGEIPTSVLLGVLYFAFGPFLWLRCRRAVGRGARA